MSLPACSANLPMQGVSESQAFPQPMCQQQPSFGCYQRPTLDPKMLNQISQIGLQLRDFVTYCDSTLADLASAHRTECLDAQTSNWDLMGYFITRSSHRKNYAVSNRVDELRNRAWEINQSLMQIGYSGIHLNTDFNGEGIRQAEDAEHSFFANWFTSNSYSSYASLDTMDQISLTTDKIRRVRNQAENGSYCLSYLCQPARPFLASKL